MNRCHTALTKHLGDPHRKHKYNVLVFASKLGIFWTGLVHDLTKFTPTEFGLSVKYFHGKKSPTIVERKDNDGFSYLCVAHTGRNKHHWQYWVDYTREDIIEDYCTEMYMSYQDYYAWAETTGYEFFDMGDKLSNGVGVVTYGYYGHDY